MSGELKILQSVTKPRLREGWSYVLKTMQLESALAEANTSLHVTLSYWQHPPIARGHSILDAFFWTQNELFDYDRLYVRAGCVPSEQRLAAAEALVAQVFPEFMAWVRGLEALPLNSPVRQQKPMFDASWKDEDIHLWRRP